jgi:signal transduction histidine kinase
MPATEPASATPQRLLLLPPVMLALERWRSGEADGADELRAAIVELAGGMGVQPGRLQIRAAPLPSLDLELGSGDRGAEVLLRSPGEAAPIGSVRLAGEAQSVSVVARALELALDAARSSARADRSHRQLEALDAAVRGIGGVLDVERVLQLITDRVRDLVDAQYAALGIVDADGRIEQFITSGMSDEVRSRIGPLPRGHGLLGLIIRENRAYRVSDIGTHPDRYGFPPEHPEMHSFLGTPILARGEPVGRLYLTNKLGANEFSEDDQALVEMFALHAGIAIENARLHDQVRRLAVVDERDRISRDLHDSIIQSIYAQTLALDDVPELVETDPAEAGRRVDEAIEALHAVIRDIRNFIFGLRPVLLESGDLADGLEHLATELRRNGGVMVELSVEGREVLDDLPIELVAELLAVTREALSNVARHARATSAAIRVAPVAEALTLEISDDGDGFDAAGRVDSGHHGLANMRARMRAAGGSFEMTSTPGEGTRIILTIPRHAGGDFTEGDRR